MYTQKEAFQSCIYSCLKVIRLYDWLLDLYVLDFFVDKHWDKLPMCWQECFDKTDPAQLGLILTGKPTSQVFPLSFLSLINCVKAYGVPRESSYKEETRISSNWNLDSCGNHPNLKNLFLKHVKLKKRHEISRMAEVVDKTGQRSGCKSVVDFGSGLGHLVRMLAYKYELNAAGIECQLQLTEEARKLDLELEYTAKKHLSPESVKKLIRPTHYNMTLKSHDQLSAIFPYNYGLIGLHPCGDLGPLLLKHFITNQQVKFICLVSCCFMKLTTNSSNNGYPLSKYVGSLNCDLSFVSREIACHAIEVYCDRLVEGNYENLKVHAYRAALEAILVEHDPILRHAPVRSIKHTQSMTFKRYCELATEKLNIELACDWSVYSALVDQWRRVVTVYTLRLALAPLVETLILLDRVLFVLEHGMSCEIHPVFDPKLSPRNHIIIARRSPI